MLNKESKILTDKLGLLNGILAKAPQFDMYNNSIALCFRGSIAHGTFIPNSNPNSVDDKDIIGIAIPPKNYFFSLQNFEQFEKIEGIWDVLIYDFRKFVRLLVKSNPNVMQVLWTPPELFIKRTDAFEVLYRNRELFANKGIYKAFCGYSHAQLQKMEHMVYQGYMGQKRKELVDKYGYDCKNAQHLIRLLRQGIEFLNTGELTVQRPDAQELIDIKTGKWSIEKVKKVAEKLFTDLQTAYEQSTLPDSPDIEQINCLVEQILVTHFQVKGWETK
jgi:predicted nucleotidyltransferase